MQPFIAIIDNTKKGVKRIYPGFAKEEPVCTESIPLNTEFTEQTTVSMPELSSIPKTWKLFHANKPNGNIMPSLEAPNDEDMSEIETGHDPEAQLHNLASMAVPVECSQISCTTVNHHSAV